MFNERLADGGIYNGFCANKILIILHYIICVHSLCTIFVNQSKVIVVMVLFRKCQTHQLNESHLITNLMEAKRKYDIKH